MASADTKKETPAASPAKSTTVPLKSAADVAEYLTEKQKTASPLSSEWAQLEDLYNKKLWHQLTLKVKEFVQHPDMEKGTNIIELYQNFIVNFENKINPLSLIEISSSVSDKYRDKREAIKFLETMEPKVKCNEQAWILCKVLQGQIYMDRYDDVTSCSKIIDEVESTLQEVDGVTPVHRRYYKLSYEYYRVRGPLERFYRAGLRYVGSGKEISAYTLMIEAKHIVLAAVYAPEVYDLSELLEHPILGALMGTKDEWAADLVRAVVEGDVEAYRKLRTSITPVKHVMNEKGIYQKIAILCLMGMAYNRKPSKRILTFNEIAEKAQIQYDDVELLVMKAMARKLIRGSINQVEAIVTITWVKPRALTRKQIGELAENLDEWCQVVKKTADMLEEKAGDVVTF